MQEEQFPKQTKPQAQEKFTCCIPIEVVDPVTGIFTLVSCGHEKDEATLQSMKVFPDSFPMKMMHITMEEKYYDLVIKEKNLKMYDDPYAISRTLNCRDLAMAQTMLNHLIGNVAWIVVDEHSKLSVLLLRWYGVQELLTIYH